LYLLKNRPDGPQIFNIKNVPLLYILPLKYTVPPQKFSEKKKKHAGSPNFIYFGEREMEAVTQATKEDRIRGSLLGLAWGGKIHASVAAASL